MSREVEYFMKKQVEQYLQDKSHLIKEVNEKIWEYAEVGFEEKKSSSLYQRLLEDEGFSVEMGVAGMPTAFVATYGSGKPVIGITAEYDALPNLSQHAGLPEQEPIEENGNGHGCGHNSLGAASLGAALSVKEYIKNNNVTGTIKLFGCPSEEKDNGKSFMAREGIFDDVDSVFTWHPMDQNAVWGFGSLANISVVFNFKGKTSHAAASPHLGRSALDSAEIMSVGTNYLREHIIPEARVHYAYLDVGGKAPNVVQGSSSVHYYIRAPKAAQVIEIFERVKDVAKGAALITGTESTFEIQTGLSDFIPNPVLSNVLQDSMEEFGAPKFTEEDYKQARTFFNTLSEGEQKQVEKDLIKNYGKERAEHLIENPLSTDIAPLQLVSMAMPGSTDVGDVSYVTPTAQLLMATTALGTSPHTWQMTAQGNTDTALKGVHAAAGAMAMASIKVLENPVIAQEAKEALHLETGGEYICPIPKDVQPKIK